jgi:rRNA maturation endonuclease Nob1
MLKTVEARELEGGLIEPKHEVEVVCAACGYDLDESELEADTCADCGAPLNLKQNIAIHTTTVPAAGGGVM